jgi:anti-anti-sigma factor
LKTETRLKHPGKILVKSDRENVKKESRFQTIGGEMHLEEKIRGEVAVLVMNGDLLDEDDALKVHQKITSLMVDGIKKIVFDLQSLHQVNRSGLDTLMKAFQRAREKGAEIRLAQIDRHIDNILVKTRLVKTFNTYETVGRALASYVA